MHRRRRRCFSVLHAIVVLCIAALHRVVHAQREAAGRRLRVACLALSFSPLPTLRIQWNRTIERKISPQPRVPLLLLLDGSLL